MKKLGKNGQVNIIFSLLQMFPDVVHVVKRLHGLLCNWHLLCRGDGTNISLKALRVDPNREKRERMRKLVCEASLRRKDQVDFSYIIEISQQSVINHVSLFSYVTVTIMPEVYAVWSSNPPGILKSIQLLPFVMLFIYIESCKLITKTLLCKNVRELAL